MELLRVILQQLSITVNPVNDAPVAQDGSNTKEEDTDQTITLSASDVDGDDLTYTIGTAPTNGTVTLTGAEAVYTPNENFNGTDSFTFTSSDGTIESNLATSSYYCKPLSMTLPLLKMVRIPKKKIPIKQSRYQHLMWMEMT